MRMSNYLELAKPFRTLKIYSEHCKTSQPFVKRFGTL